MKAIINWFIAPYQIVRTELKLFSKLKKEETTTKDEKMRIFQLQVFNILLLLVYSLFFSLFCLYRNSNVVDWYALSGIVVGLIMMTHSILNCLMLVEAD